MNHQEILNAFDSAEVTNENEQPSYPEGVFVNYQGELLESGHVIAPLDVLHNFFNRKSDSNKYLSAEQQEDLEREFKEYLSKELW